MTRSLSKVRAEAGRKGGKARKRRQTVFGRSFPILVPTKATVERRLAEDAVLLARVLESSPQWRHEWVRATVARDYVMLVRGAKILCENVAARGGVVQRGEQQAYRSCRHVAKLFHKDLRLPGTVDAGPFAIPPLPIDEEAQALLEAEGMRKKLQRICQQFGIEGSPARK